MRSDDGLTVRDRVWWSDVDVMGVMFFARYLRFAEMAESALFRSLGYTYESLRARYGIWLARVHLDVDYRMPARLDDELTCRAQLVRCGGASLDLRFPIDRADNGRRTADVRLVLACLDEASLGSTRIPAALRAALEPLVTVGDA